MFARRLFAICLVCASLLIGTGHAAIAKTIFATVDDVVTTPHDTAVDIDVTANDHGQAVEVLVETSPQHGKWTIHGLIIHYVPDPGYVGRDTFLYSAYGCV